MYREMIRCVDCGREFERHSSMQIRCPECKKEHDKEKDRMRKRTKYVSADKLKSAVYINGHPQVCTHMESCFYGSHNGNGCSYALEEKKTRRSQGLWIVDGKCPAYEKKGRKRKRSQLNLFVDMPRSPKNYGEV